MRRLPPRSATGDARYSGLPRSKLKSNINLLLEIPLHPPMHPSKHDESSADSEILGIWNAQLPGTKPYGRKHLASEG